MNSFNPVQYVDAFRMAGISMIVLGAGLLIAVVAASLFKKKPECNCDD